MFNKRVWIDGETRAQKYLKKLGYKIIGTNMKVAGVEIDIIALCPKRLLKKELELEYRQGKVTQFSYIATAKNLEDTLVFVEVKARSSAEFGMPFEAVDANKQYRIRRAAKVFIARGDYEGMPVRFDIVSILDDQLEHLKNAF